MLYNATHIVRRCLAAFVVGVLFATFGGSWGGAAGPTKRAMIAVLLIAGIIIGLLNITGKKATAVLMATMALVLLGIWGTTAVFQPVCGLSQGLGENVIGMIDVFALLMATAAVMRDTSLQRQALLYPLV